MNEKQYDQQELDDVCEALEADFPIYETLLVEAAKMHIDQLELKHKWMMLHWMLQWEGLPIDDLKAFFEQANLGTEPLEVLELSARRIAQSKGAKGGKGRKARYQAIDEQIISAYRASPEAQSQKTIKGAVRILTRNNPQFEPSERKVHDLISAERKIAE
jgi:hypothetical protein